MPTPRLKKKKSTCKKVFFTVVDAYQPGYCGGSFNFFPMAPLFPNNLRVAIGGFTEQISTDSLKCFQAGTESEEAIMAGR